MNYDYADLSGWTTTNVRLMWGMFARATDGNIPIGSWDVSSVTNMMEMFYEVPNFNTDLSAWDVSNVINMASIFQLAANFNNGESGNTRSNPLNWTTTKVTNMSGMFNQTSFNQELGSNFTTNNVTSMETMFKNCNMTGDQYMNTWNTSKVTTMKQMFENASAFNSDISDWDTSNVTNMMDMFNGALIFNQNISGWTTSNVNTTERMFKSAQAFLVDIRNLFQNVVDNNRKQMFEGATAFNNFFYDTGYPGYDPNDTQNQWRWTPRTSFWSSTTTGQLALTFNHTSGFDVNLPILGGVTATILWGDGDSSTGVNPNSITHTYASGGTYTIIIQRTSGAATTFGGGSGITSWTGAEYLTQISTFNNTTWNLGGSVSSFNRLGYNATKLTSVPTGIPTSIRNLSDMFNGAIAFNANISWNTRYVTDMSNMFNGAIAFNANISWDTRNVTNMSNMFNGAVAFNASNISNWNTNSVTDMSNMFNGATAFDQTINSWDVRNVTNMSDMFNGATGFNSNVGGWLPIAVTNMSNMFNGATLFNQDITHWNTGVGRVTYTDMFINSGLSSNTPSDTYFNNFLKLSFTGVASIALPISSTGSLNVYIYWGDGSNQINYTSGTISTTYASSGNYDVTIWGDATTFGSGSTAWTGSDKLASVSAVDPTTWHLTGLVSVFRNV